MWHTKITLLNQTIIECLNETEEKKIIRAFTDLGIKLLDANFGFVWLNSSESDTLELVYRSSTTPYNPKPPKENGRNYRVLKSSVPEFVSQIQKKSDHDDVSTYMKSFVIIPIGHRGKIYGTIVLCFKKTENFLIEKRILSELLGNNAAQAITVRRLIASEQERHFIENERSKAEFIAEATHELRTPLAIIKGNIDLALRNKSVNERQFTKTLKAIDYEVQHAAELVSDLTLLIKSNQYSQRKMVSHDVRLDRLMSNITKRFKTLTDKKDISINIQNLSNISIPGDEFYLDKLFSNIIKNAIIYGREGGRIVISGKKAGKFIHVDVYDNGIGISQEDLTRIFERFYRSEEAREKNHEGTGLGLAIVKWIAEAHGGTVSVVSTKDEGSTFTVTLPMNGV